MNTVTRNKVELPLVLKDFKKGEKLGAKYHTLPDVAVYNAQGILDKETTQSNLNKMLEFLGLDLVAGFIDARKDLFAQKVAAKESNTKYVEYDYTPPVDKDGKQPPVEKRQRVESENLEGIIKDFQEWSAQGETLGALRESLDKVLAEINSLVLIDPVTKQMSAEVVARFGSLQAESQRIMAAMEARKRVKDEDEADSEKAATESDTTATA